jgi:two-component system NtrC family sensor kinase
MKFILKIVLLFLPVFANAQFDSTWGFVSAQGASNLRSNLPNEKNDTLLMSDYRSLGFFYQETKLDSALYFHQQQLKLAKKLDLKMWLADAYSQVGYLYLFMGNITKGYDNFIEANKIADNPKNENSNWHPWVFSNAQSLHDARLRVLAMNDNGLGNLYYSMGDTVKGRQAYQKIMDLGELVKNGKILSTVYGNLAFYLPTDSLILFTKKAIQFENQSGYKKNIGSNLLLLAKAFFDKQKYDSAIFYIYASVSANLEQQNLRMLSTTYSAMAGVYGFQHNPDSSIYYGKKILATAESIQVPQAFLSAYTVLAHEYGIIKNIDSAYKYGELARNLGDSLNNARIKQLTDFQTSSFKEQLSLRKINEDKTVYQNKLKLYVAIGGLVALLFVALILYRNNRGKQKANKVLESTLTDLKATQSQLIQSEKMASLGELTAGIAHEIQNPLNFVNNFSELNTELIEEIKTAINNKDYEEVKALAKDVDENEQKILFHGKRADAIVKGMLQHSRSSTGVKEPTDINALCDEYLRLSYHGLRAKDKNFNATMLTDFDDSIGKINVLPQELGRVILNLLTNAFYAVHEKALASASEPTAAKYEPTVTISTKRSLSFGEGRGEVIISVSDNGNGIPQNVMDKIFQPFFTTKPTGQGTGLGLSMSYDIITKGHAGTITAETIENKGTTFKIILPL